MCVMPLKTKDKINLGDYLDVNDFKFLQADATMCQQLRTQIAASALE